MTRKRFVKLLMARGFGRNLANLEASDARKKGQSYEQHYAEYVRHMERVQAFDTMLAASKELTEAFRRIAISAAVACNAFAEAFNSIRV